MRIRLLVSLTATCSALLLGVACSKQETPAVTAATAPPETKIATGNATTAAAKKHAKACDIVTAVEMSAILGGAVEASSGSNERPPASTECDYASASGPSRYVELQVDWGGGDQQALGSAAGLANAAAPPGSVDALKGLGERAYQVTADQIFISTGGDLMMIRFAPRSGEVIAKARRIFEAAKPRM